MSEPFIAVPLPPSLNSIWRATTGHNGKPHFYINKRYATWKRVADNMLMAMRPRPAKVLGAFTVEITLNQDKRRGDADNRAKAPLDFLQRANLIENDSLADRVEIKWGFAPEGARIVLRSTCDPLRRAEGMAG